MGHYLRMDKIVDNQRIVACADIHSALHHCLRAPDGVLVVARTAQMVVGQLARRTDDDGIGTDGRVDVFPHGKRVPPLYHCHQHIADSVLMPTVCDAHHSPLL